jgi:hypothetical protein
MVGIFVEANKLDQTSFTAIYGRIEFGIAYREQEGSDGEAFRRAECRHGLEASSQSKSTVAICPAVAASGSSKQMPRPALSSSSGGLNQRVRDTRSAHSFSANTTRTAYCSTPRSQIEPSSKVPSDLPLFYAES